MVTIKRARVLSLRFQSAVAATFMMLICYSADADGHDGLDEWIGGIKYSRVKTVYRFMPGDVPTHDYADRDTKAATCFGDGALKTQRRELHSLGHGLNRDHRESDFEFILRKDTMSYVSSGTYYVHAAHVSTTGRELQMNAGEARKNCRDLFRMQVFGERRRIIIGVIEVLKLSYRLEIGTSDTALRPSASDVYRLVGFAVKPLFEALLPGSGEFLSLFEDSGLLALTGTVRDGSVFPDADPDLQQKGLELWSSDSYRYGLTVWGPPVVTTVALSDCLARRVLLRGTCKR